MDLPPPVAPDDADRLTRLDAEAHVLEHGLLRIIGEGHVIEHDLPAERAGIACAGSLRHDHVGIEDRLDALDRDRGLGDRVAHLGEILHRLEELAQVGEEDGQLPHRHRVGEDQRRATIEHESGAHRGGDRHRRGEKGLHLSSGERGIDRRSADLLQVLLLDGFRTERPHHSRRLQTLLHHCHDVALVMAHLVRGAFHGAVEARHEEQQERRHRHRHESEVPVEPEHDAQHAENREQIDEDSERSGRSEVLDRLHVVDDGRQDRAELVTVVVGERESLEVVVDLIAQVVRHPLGGALGEVVLDVARDRAEQGDQQRADGGDRGELQPVASQRRNVEVLKPCRWLVGADDVVEDDLQRPGSGDAHGRLHEHGDEDDEQPAAVRAQES